MKKKEEEPPGPRDQYDIDAVPKQIQGLSPVTRAMYIILQKSPEKWFEAEELEQEIAKNFPKAFKKREKPISWGFPFAGTSLEKRGLIEIKRDERGRRSYKLKK